MSIYAPDHADALAELRAAGAAVTFTLSSPGTYDPETGLYSSPVTSTVSGYALRTKGDPLEYERLTLTETVAPTLLFAPSTFGGTPALDATVSWGGTTYTVKSANPLDPDGTAILWRVVVA